MTILPMVPGQLTGLAPPREDITETCREVAKRARTRWGRRIGDGVEFDSPHRHRVRAALVNARQLWAVCWAKPATSPHRRPWGEGPVITHT